MNENKNTLENSTDLRVLNNEQFDEAFDVAFKVAEETSSPLTLFRVDINQLKPVNDTLGHDRGTALIKDINNMEAILIRTTFRVNPSDNRSPNTLDIASIPSPRVADRIDAASGRTGGDESSAIINEGTEVAKIVAQRLLDVTDLYLARPENKHLRKLGVGVAVGWATYEPGMTKEELSNEADQAMYRMKLDQLPKLNRIRRICFDLGRFCLKISGVESRNVDKYVQKHHKKAA